MPLCRACHTAVHNSKSLGFGTAHDPKFMDLAAEMYEDGWTFVQLAVFFNAAPGYEPIRGKKFGSTSFDRAFKARGVVRRHKGRRRNDETVHAYQERMGYSV